MSSEKTKEYLRKYRQDNADRIRSVNRKWRQSNQEKILLVNRAWYKNNKDKVLDYNQKWRRENKDKVIRSARKHYYENRDKCLSTAREWRQNNKVKCRATAAEYYKANSYRYRNSCREWYHRNKDKDRAKQARRMKYMESYVRAHKLHHGCCVCNYKKTHSALCFHHKDPRQKSFELSKTPKSWKRTRREMAKCDVMCLNCHAELHESEGYSNGHMTEDVPGQIMLFEDHS